MRGNQIGTRQIGSTETGRYRARTLMQLPRQDGWVVVQVLNGRGNVDVIQQPSAQNGYTATVRIQDPASGAADYRLVAFWQAYGSGGAYGGSSNVYGNGNGRGRSARNNGRRDGDDDGDADDRNDGNGRDRNGVNSRNGQYPNAGYPNGGYPGAGYPNGQYPDSRYPNGQYPNSQYPNSRYPNSGNRNGQYGNQSSLRWTGNVDGELEIRIQNGRVAYRNLSGNQPTNIRTSGALGAPTRSNARVFMTQNQGRGSINLVQQPSAYNGYTTVIRVRDPQSGYGYYDFNVTME
jgi:hypothetical protein